MIDSSSCVAKRCEEKQCPEHNTLRKLWITEMWIDIGTQEPVVTVPNMELHNSHHLPLIWESFIMGDTFCFRVNKTYIRFLLYV